MIEGIVKKIMFTGIEKYAKKYAISDTQSQIKVTDNENGSVFYEMCNNYVAQEQVSFLNIMDKKMDIFQYERLASPFLKKSLAECADENGINVNQICCFILKYKDSNSKDQVGLGFYTTDSIMKKLKIVSLSKHLEKLGL